MKVKLRVVIGIFLIALVSAATRADQTPALRPVMRHKLEHSKELLAAVVMGDWNVIDREGQALVALTREPTWAVLNSPDFVLQSDAFVGSLEKLLEASRRRDLDATVQGEGALVVSCVQCHESLKVLHGSVQRKGL